MIVDRASYLRQFLKDRDVASVSPSSRFLVRRVLRALAPGDPPKVVVEYGPAEGVITRRILDTLGDGAVVVAVERNEAFCRALAHHPDRRLDVVHGDVRDIRMILRSRGLAAADAVVSGIPFSRLEPGERESLVRTTRSLLVPGGRFVAYQVRTSVLPVLRRHFRRVQASFELLNIPPAFVFTAVK